MGVPGLVVSGVGQGSKRQDRMCGVSLRGLEHYIAEEQGLTV